MLRASLVPKGTVTGLKYEMSDDSVVSEGSLKKIIQCEANLLAVSSSKLIVPTIIAMLLACPVPLIFGWKLIPTTLLSGAV